MKYGRMFLSWIAMEEKGGLRVSHYPVAIDCRRKALGKICFDERRIEFIMKIGRVFTKKRV